MKIILVHGFNVKDGGRNTVDQLAPHLIEAGHEVDTDQADYGFFSLWAVRFRKHSAVRRIAKALENADAVISHSNGANFVNQALRMLEHRPRHYLEIRIAPALNRSTGCAENVDQCTVFHSRTDRWVWLSRFLPFHPWGQQGCKGYSGDDSRIRNWDFTSMVPDHSDYFDSENIEFVAKEALIALERP